MANYTLQPGSSIEHRRDDAGNILVTVTIPPGQPGQGVYVAVGAPLSQIAQEAIEFANEPGCTIDVGGDAATLQYITVRVEL